MGISPSGRGGGVMVSLSGGCGLDLSEFKGEEGEYASTGGGGAALGEEGGSGGGESWDRFSSSSDVGDTGSMMVSSGLL